MRWVVMRDYRWIDGASLAKEISDVRVPVSDKVFYRAGALTSAYRRKGDQ